VCRFAPAALRDRGSPSLAAFVGIRLGVIGELEASPTSRHMSGFRGVTRYFHTLPRTRCDWLVAPGLSRFHEYPGRFRRRGNERALPSPRRLLPSRR